MSMTRETAYGLMKAELDKWIKWNPDPGTPHWEMMQAVQVALNALRPVSREQELEAENKELKERIVNWRKYMAPTREQVKQMWKGCYMCEEYGYFMFSAWKSQSRDVHPDCMGSSMFCPHCGKPLTNAAVDIIMWRLEALHEEN